MPRAGLRAALACCSWSALSLTSVSTEPPPATPAGSAVPALPPATPIAWKATYAAADPAAAQRFAVDYLGARAIPEPHPGGNGTCGLIKWVVFDGSAPTCHDAGAAACKFGWMMHFVDLFSHRVGNFTLQDWRDYMEALDGNITYTGAHRYCPAQLSISLALPPFHLLRPRDFFAGAVTTSTWTTMSASS